jgi:hypothetical protein
MLSKAGYSGDKMAMQVRSMKHELERKLRTVTQRLEELDGRLRTLEGRADDRPLVGRGLSGTETTQAPKVS